MSSTHALATHSTALPKLRQECCPSHINRQCGDSCKSTKIPQLPPPRRYSGQMKERGLERKRKKYQRVWQFVLPDRRRGTGGNKNVCAIARCSVNFWFSFRNNALSRGTISHFKYPRRHIHKRVCLELHSVVRVGCCTKDGRLLLEFFSCGGRANRTGRW